jgi:hypothetical protein
MLHPTIINLNQDIALIQLYLKNHQKSGFSDMTRLLESLSIKLFRATHGLTLHNENLFHANFPAIDLADDGARTAIQVTSNANVKKVGHTVKQFEKYDLKSHFDRLFVFGFLDAKAPKTLPNYCTLFVPGTLVSMVIDKHDQELVQDLIDEVEQHRDYTRLHPYQDEPCLDIVLRCIDRNAVKHRMESEGHIDAMVKGLNEITELISKGTINKRSKGKSVDQFQNEKIQEFLVTVRHKIGEIVGVINRSRDGGEMVNLNMESRTRIDGLKQEIIDLSNAIAAAVGLPIRLHAI